MSQSAVYTIAIFIVFYTQRDVKWKTKFESGNISLHSTRALALPVLNTRKSRTDISLDYYKSVGGILATVESQRGYLPTP